MKNLLLLAMSLSSLFMLGCDKSPEQNPGATPPPLPELPASSYDDEVYYTQPEKYAREIDFVKEYEVDNDFATDDSQKLQQAIDFASMTGAGLIKIAKGNYSFAKIEIKSDVTIEIDHEAVIRPTQQKTSGGFMMFTTRGVDASIQKKNFCIKGVGGKFTIDLRHMGFDDAKIRCFWIGNATNFMLADMKILDNNTKYAAVVLNAEDVDGSLYGPTYGVVKNLDNYGSNYGYGLVQMQYGQKILYKNIYSEGGATLRFESHTNNLKENVSLKAIDQVVGYDVRNENGHAAVMLSPHFVKNGWVDLCKIESISSEYTVLVSGGFTTKEEAAMGLTPGYFSSQTRIREISAVSGDNAQIHPKHFKYVPLSLQGKLPSSDPFDAKQGFSLGVVLYAGEFVLNFTRNDILKSDGFIEEQIVVLEPNCEKVPY